MDRTDAAERALRRCLEPRARGMPSAVNHAAEMRMVLSRGLVMFWMRTAR